mgnify:FL=1|jgi:hypothetical protein
MKTCSRKDLIISIENCIDSIGAHTDSADKAVGSVLKKHQVRNLEKASLSVLNDIFSELYAIEADLK